MYLEYFGLSAQPFQLTPDSGFLFMSEPHRRAKAYMDYTVWNREGFVVITGEIGCGKTTLIQKLLSDLDDDVAVAKVFQTQLDEVQFLQGKQIVLIVDDAHNLSLKVPEEIRMFAGLETRKEKILHVILVGQPQLNEMLDHPEMQQLMQRVKLRYHIRALTEPEVADYVRHRLSIAGSSNRPLFAPQALPVIYRYAGGIPRLINTLCDTALTSAYADNLPGVTAEIVEATAKELQWPLHSERVEKNRSQVKAAAGEVGVHAILREQSRALTAISSQLGKLEEQAPALESIGKSLVAIERHLRNLLLSQKVQPGSDSTPERQQRSG